MATCRVNALIGQRKPMIFARNATSCPKSQRILNPLARCRPERRKRTSYDIQGRAARSVPAMRRDARSGVGIFLTWCAACLYHCIGNLLHRLRVGSADGRPASSPAGPRPLGLPRPSPDSALNECTREEQSRHIGK
jgi:hypothetical protein